MKHTSAKSARWHHLGRASFVLAGMGALAVLAPACGPKGPAGPQAPAPVPVRVATVEKQTVPVEVRTIGHVEPFAVVRVKSRVGGQVTKIGFVEGQDVKAGDLLVTIDPRPYASQVAQAAAALERDRARAKNTEEDAKRYEDLVKKDYVTREQYDLALTNAAAARATAVADQAALDDAKLSLQFCTITAPIAGRTGSLLVHLGNVIKANDDAPLVVINQVEPVYVTLTVPEQTLTAINERRAAGVLPVRAARKAAPDDAIPGEVTFVDNGVDMATGTILLKATFPNKDRRLWPGEFVDVVLTLGEDRDVVTAPTSAVQTGQKGAFVFVVKSDKTVESRPVTVARTLGPVAVVSSGLTAGETVVIDGQLRLAPGLSVEIAKDEVAEAGRAAEPPADAAGKKAGTTRDGAAAPAPSAAKEVAR